MIPDLIVLVGLYVTERMTEVLAGGREGKAAKAVAGLVLLFALLSIAANLFSVGTGGPPRP